MSTPQGGIFALGTASHAYLEIEPATPPRYTRPVTGAYYFVPSADSLRTRIRG
jgi:hypothetical protein